MIFRRSLVSELANTAGAVFTVIFSIVLTIGLVRILGLAAGGRIDSGTVMEMVVYEALVNLAPLLAVSLFIAVLITLTRSWLDSEMVVWFSSGGISLVSWIRPVLRFSIPIILLITALSLVISPWAKGQSEMNREVWSQRDDVDRLSPGRFIEISGGKQVFFIEEVSADGLSVKNVFLTERIEHLSQRTLREKLLSYLSNAAEKNGSDTVVIPLNRQELADYLAVDRSALSAVISALRSQGVIDAHKNRFTLYRHSSATHVSDTK